MDLDTQVETAPDLKGWPVISPTLHVLSMPALVFLRYGFGYSYLRPKLIFLALTWGSFLLSYIVWKTPSRHYTFGALAIFLSLVSTLYLVHLTWSLIKEWRSKGKHDRFSGRSHLLNLLPGIREDSPAKTWVYLLAEPALVILAGLIAGRWIAEYLGLVLIGAGISLFFKEALNAWLTTRHKKRRKDNLIDAGDSVEDPAEAKGPVKSTRKPKSPTKEEGGFPM